MIGNKDITITLEETIMAITVLQGDITIERVVTITEIVIIMANLISTIDIAKIISMIRMIMMVFINNVKDAILVKIIAIR